MSIFQAIAAFFKAFSGNVGTNNAPPTATQQPEAPPEQTPAPAPYPSQPQQVATPPVAAGDAVVVPTVNSASGMQQYFALYTGEKITVADWEQAAKAIGCEASVIKAFAHVEAPNSGFDSSNRPTILYERHVFSRCTAHQFDAAHPDISSTKAYTTKKVDDAGTPIPATDRYNGVAQYARFAAAWALDQNAAIQACSVGKFQVLGENYKRVGFDFPKGFWSAACVSERMHLLKFFLPFALTASASGHGTLRDALAQKNWANAAYIYNGPGYKANNYDVKLKQAYDAINAGTLVII